MKRPFEILLVVASFAGVSLLLFLDRQQPMFDLEVGEGQLVPEGIVAPVDFAVPMGADEEREMRGRLELETPIYLVYDDEEWSRLEPVLRSRMLAVTSDTTFVNGAVGLLQAMYDKGVMVDIESLRASFTGDSAVVRRGGDDSRELPLGSLNLHQFSEVSRAFRQSLEGGGLPSGTADSLAALLLPNVTTDSARRSDLIESRIAACDGIDTVFRSGDVLVPPGGRITRENIRWLSALRESEHSIAGGRWTRYLLARLLLVTGLVCVVILYVRDSMPETWKSRSRSLLLMTAWILSLAGTGLAWLIVGSPIRGSFASLVTFGAALTGIFFRRRHAAVLSFVFAAATAAGQPHAYSSVLVTAAAGSLAGYAAWDLRRRSSIPWSIGLSAMGGVSMLLLCRLLDISTGTRGLFAPLVEIVLSSVAGVGLASALLQIFEKVFGVFTVLSIGEARNRSHPLLVDLSRFAMGTWQHSQDVADLAAEAARAIEADADLAEAGGLYHDVGKLKEPYYFIENLTHGTGDQANPHDSMHPMESYRRVIAHVPEGVRLAKKFRVPAPIIDIIEQHHGTTCVKSFYEKAKRLAASPDEVRQSDYRYRGPIPASREAALVMLADAVDSAAKGIQSPSMETIASTVATVIEDKDTDGQLDNCHITRGNLKSIERAFLQVLRGRFHERVKDYPYGSEPDRNGGM